MGKGAQDSQLLCYHGRTHGHDFDDRGHVRRVRARVQSDLVQTRHGRRGAPYFLDYFEEVARREGFWRDDLVQKILDNHGSPRGLKDVPENWQRVLATA